MGEFTPKAVLLFVAGAVSTAFGAGVTFTVWSDAHPTGTEIADSLGCADYLVDPETGNTKGDASLMRCPAAKDARYARAELMRLRGEITRLRRDLARGFGRALTFEPSVRDQAGKAAVILFDREVQMGVPPEVAMQHVLEADF